MATFYGGEQFIQRIKVSGVNTDLDTNENPIIYTIPTGYYGKLKFAYMGQYVPADIQFYYLQGAGNCAMHLVAPGLNIVFNQAFQHPSIYSGGNYENLKTGQYGSQGNLFNLFCEEGSRFVLSSDISNNEVKYELIVDLYKLP